jgi:hypothetical protein
MIAPLELSRNAKIVFSKKAAAMTHMKPMIDENRIAFAGTPATVDPHQHFGRLVTRVEDEQHARRGV